MDTSLIISSTNAGKKLQKAITNINPEKDNAVLKTFAQKVNALTTNTYLDATRVNKMSVEEEYQQGGGTSKQEGIITATELNYTMPSGSFNIDGNFTFTTNSGQPIFYVSATKKGDSIASGSSITLHNIDDGRIDFFAPETDEFTAAHWWCTVYYE